MFGDFPTRAGQHTGLMQAAAKRPIHRVVTIVQISIKWGFAAPKAAQQNLLRSHPDVPAEYAPCFTPGFPGPPPGRRTPILWRIDCLSLRMAFRTGDSIRLRLTHN